MTKYIHTGRFLADRYTRAEKEADEWYPCGGGHVQSRYEDESGDVCCRRCGDVLDLDPCDCGHPDHEGLSWSYCNDRHDKLRPHQQGLMAHRRWPPER